MFYNDVDFLIITSSFFYLICLPNVSCSSSISFYRCSVMMLVLSLSLAHLSSPVFSLLIYLYQRSVPMPFPSLSLFHLSSPVCITYPLCYSSPRHLIHFLYPRCCCWTSFSLPSSSWPSRSSSSSGGRTCQPLWSSHSSMGECVWLVVLLRMCVGVKSLHYHL